jgi:hypothetical protein
MNTQISSPEISLRRTPYASVKKRNQTHTHHRSGLGQQQPFRRHRIFDENDLRSSTHTVVYDSSKAMNSSILIPTRRTIASPDDNNLTISSFGGSGNESDYDNNQCNNDFSKIARYLSSSSSRIVKIPVNDFNQSDELTRTDDLLLGDQNEIVLNNNSNIHSNISNNENDDEDNDHTEARVDLSDDNDDDIDADENTIQSTIINNNQQSDNNVISSTNSFQPSSNHRTTNMISMKPTTTTTNTLDDSAPPNYPSYRKDPLTTRKLLDIRSHLLLNTTLDAT